MKDPDFLGFEENLDSMKRIMMDTIYHFNAIIQVNITLKKFFPNSRNDKSIAQEI